MALGQQQPSIAGVLRGSAAPSVTPAREWTTHLEAAALFVGSAIGEETGWRGDALPRLQVGTSAVGASIIVGAVWAVRQARLSSSGERVTIEAGSGRPIRPASRALARDGGVS
jgi:hypothetical protein